MRRESGKCKPKTFSVWAGYCLPLVGPELLNKFGVDKTS
jgi:hypothetical protein